MKQLLVLVCLVAAAVALGTPEYLSRDPQKLCLGTYEEGTATFVCTPETKPTTCLNDLAFQGHQNDKDLPKCADKAAKGTKTGSK